MVLLAKQSPETPPVDSGSLAYVRLSCATSDPGIVLIKGLSQTPVLPSTLPLVPLLQRTPRDPTVRAFDIIR